MPPAQVQGLPAAGAGLLQLRQPKRRQELAPLQAKRWGQVHTTVLPAGGPSREQACYSSVSCSGQLNAVVLSLKFSVAVSDLLLWRAENESECLS